MTSTLLNHTRKTHEDLFFPCIAMILPIDQGNTPAKHTERLIEQAENKLRDTYRKDRVTPVIEKLRHALSRVNHTGNKKSAVVFVSPMHEKLIHLDVSLEESVLIDESFEIRDLLSNIQPTGKYIALVHSAETFKIYLGDADNLVRLKETIPNIIEAYKNDTAEKIEYFSDTTDRKEVLMDKFIHHIDKELDHVLNSYRLPVYVIGTERMNGHFKKYTHHEKAVVEFIHGNYDDAKPHELLAVIEPHLATLREAENHKLLADIEEAASADRLSTGIDEVWNNAFDKKGRLLLVEKNYYFPYAPGNTGTLDREVKDLHPSLVKDAVDVIIEQVLGSGGEVRFTDTSVMNDLQHIALFLYY